MDYASVMWLITLIIVITIHSVCGTFSRQVYMLCHWLHDLFIEILFAAGI